MNLAGYQDDYAVAIQEKILNALPDMPDWFKQMYPSGDPDKAIIPQGQITTTGTTPSTTSNFWSNLPSIVTAGLTAYQTIQLQNINADLIKAGKPPLTAAQAAALAPQFRAGLAPDTQNTLIYLALGAGALILLTSMMKNRRN
jgi:hypothetical protein